MLEINLLPPSLKQRLKNREKQKVWFTLGFLILSCLLVFDLLLILSKIYIDYRVEIKRISIEQQLQNSSKVKAIRNQANKLNKTFAHLNSFYQNRTDPIAILGSVSNYLLPGMYLDSFQYEEKNHQINIVGWAPTVDALSQFRNAIQNEKDFKKIDFSIQSQVRPKNVKFRLEIVLK